MEIAKQENQVAGAASTVEQPQKQNPPDAPKVEVKDGFTFVDGRKFVPESDLIAAKQGLEGKLEQQQTVHSQAIDTTKLELSAAQQDIAKLTAQASEAEQARQSGATSDEEVARVKQELETATTNLIALQAGADKALEYRRALLTVHYSIPADSLANKSMAELDSFEEALKALATSRGSGPGPYALGGGLGGASPMTEEERAAKVLAATDIRGTRTAETATK